VCASVIAGNGADKPFEVCAKGDNPLKPVFVMLRQIHIEKLHKLLKRWESTEGRIGTRHKVDSDRVQECNQFGCKLEQLLNDWILKSALTRHHIMIRICNKLIGLPNASERDSIIHWRNVIPLDGFFNQSFNECLETITTVLMFEQVNQVLIQTVKE